MVDLAAVQLRVELAVVNRARAVGVEEGKEGGALATPGVVHSLAERGVIAATVLATTGWGKEERGGTGRLEEGRRDGGFEAGFSGLMSGWWWTSRRRSFASSSR